ncbi:MAG: hypothetical protein NTW19_13990 [Planctomycetota bacterium]|nr:hypothetical protein [Planctomycetota bacterium]
MATNVNHTSDRALATFFKISAAFSVVGAAAGIAYGVSLHAPASLLGWFGWTGFLAANIAVWTGGTLLGIGTWAAGSQVQPSIATGEQVSRGLENAISPEARDGIAIEAPEAKTQERQLELVA